MNIILTYASSTFQTYYATPSKRRSFLFPAFSDLPALDMARNNDKGALPSCMMPYADDPLSGPETAGLAPMWDEDEYYYHHGCRHLCVLYKLKKGKRVINRILTFSLSSEDLCRPAILLLTSIVTWLFIDGQIPRVCLHSLSVCWAGI